MMIEKAKAMIDSSDREMCILGAIIMMDHLDTIIRSKLYRHKEPKNFPGFLIIRGEFGLMTTRQHWGYFIRPVAEKLYNRNREIINLDNEE